MKKTSYVVIPVIVEDEIYSIPIKHKDFLSFIDKAVAENRDRIVIAIKANGKLYKRELTIEEAYEYSRRLQVIENSIIPKELRGLLRDMTQKFLKTNRWELPLRDMEVEKAFFYLSQQRRNNVFLIGEQEVGKTAVALEVIRKIALNECPVNLQNKRVLKLDVKNILNYLEREDEQPDSKKATEGKKAEKIRDVINNFLVSYKGNIVVYITDGLEMYTNEYLKSILVLLLRNNIPLISTCDSEFFDEIFLQADIFNSKYYNYVVIEEPVMKDTIEMAWKYTDRLRYKYRNRVDISKEMVKFAVYTSPLLNSNAVNPGQTINILENAFAESYNKYRQHVKSNPDKEPETVQVTKQNIINSYHLNEKSKKYTSYEIKRAIAYHETGHCIAVIKSKHLSKLWNLRFASALPANDWGGVTFSFYNYETTQDSSKELYMDIIVNSLAGRYAQRLVCNQDTDGASSDLDHANVTAREGVMRYGLADLNETKNRIYDYEDYYLIPEKTKELIEQERNKWIHEATCRTEKLIEDNKELISIIAEKLLKEEILTGEEIYKICEEYEESKKKQLK